MNKEFAKKMIKAKRLEYEAIKEIIPERLKDRIDTFEKEAFSLIKDLAFEILSEEAHENSKCNSDDNCNKDSKNVKKISVDFN
ncbi:hypothetical protein [Clostridium sp. C2-6-12]|uniref:hypothetical protein n=1 Tax=Clostridium sp. C2-6-12 TaxID=2698832 RepID=UPI001370A3FF|nr:hypothetical protein [Clostridium sp. C2-6-12]